MPNPISKIKCDFCKVEFEKETKHIKNNKRRGFKNYCSKQCGYKGNTKSKIINCKQCGKSVLRRVSEIKKVKNTFCSRSCSVTYSNAHKKHGTRRSKLEDYLEKQLKKLYPNLQILYNDITAIKSELDIYIPSLCLAFELNGIFHYEPIFGDEKLQQTQNNDQKKFYLCHKARINLCVIDTSGQKYFKPSTSQKYLNIITKIIDDNLSAT